MVRLTLNIYDKVLYGPLKPTPKKSHYTFNLRDISRIAQGLCRAERRYCAEPIHMVRMWIHENNRVFGDRLIDDKDRKWLSDLLSAESIKTFKLDKAELFNSKRLVYGDYMDGIEVDNRVYR